MKVIVLGTGLVGYPMAVDLSQEKAFEVWAADIDQKKIARLKSKHAIHGMVCDFSSPDELKKLVAGFDLVISAVPGSLGFRTLQAVIEAGKDVVDIAFSPEDPFLLNELAEKKGVTAVIDCGVAPGMSNVLIGFADSQLDATDYVRIYVGGLPVIRQWPYEYKAVFSPVDVIEEYIRPARMVVNGVTIEKSALSDVELMDFPGVGTLESFNSDGLRTLIKTIKAPDMKEKTLRYPGHAEKMLVLRETGFFDKNEIEVSGCRIRPLDFTARLLFPTWQMQKGEEDITVMKVIVEGRKEGKNKRYTYGLLDRYDRETQTHSMARTTGYTATVTARMLALGMYERKGIIPPEYIGKEPECVDHLIKELGKRGIYYSQKIEE